MKKKTKIIFGMSLLIMVSVVIAGSIIITPAEFNLGGGDPNAIAERFNGSITFLCDGFPSSIYLDEPNMNIDDDFEDTVKGNCTGTISKVKDWTGRNYNQVNLNGTIIRSFDEEKLNIALKSYEENLF